MLFRLIIVLIDLLVIFNNAVTHNTKKFNGDIYG